MSTLTLAYALSGNHMVELPDLFPQFTENDERVVASIENGNNGSPIDTACPVQVDASAEAFDNALKYIMGPASQLMEKAVKKINEITGRGNDSSHHD